MARTLTDLPPELLLKICISVNKKGLKALRLVDRKLNGVVGERLFRRLKTTFPEDDNRTLARLAMLLASDCADYVKEINLSPDVCSYLPPVEHHILPGWFKVDCAVLNAAVNLSARFPKLEDVCIYGRFGIKDRDWAWEYGTITVDGMIEAMFSSLYRRATYLTPVSGLSLKRLQCDHDPTLALSVEFLTVMRNIERLRLHFDRFDEYHYPGDRLKDRPDISDAHDFGTHFATTWLSHNQGSLTHLHLSFRYGAGFYPKIDLRGVHFPKLKSLRLVEFQFSHDWQCDWIVSHGGLLELYLVECPILVTRISGMELDHEGYPIYGPASLDESETTYEGRWYRWYHAFKGRLPKLRRFITDTEVTRQEENFQGCCITGITFGLSSSRYEKYRKGTCGSGENLDHLNMWLQGYDGGALASLLRHTGQWRYIEGLIQRHGAFPGFWKALEGEIPDELPQIPPHIARPTFREDWRFFARRHSLPDDEDEHSDESDSGHSCYLLGD